MGKASIQRLAEHRMYTVKEAAAFFSMSLSWVRERVKSGDLDGYLCGNLLISGASINRYLAGRVVGPAILGQNSSGTNLMAKAQAASQAAKLARRQLLESGEEGAS